MFLLYSYYRHLSRVILSFLGNKSIFLRPDNHGIPSTGANPSRSDSAVADVVGELCFSHSILPFYILNRTLNQSLTGFGKDFSRILV